MVAYDLSHLTQTDQQAYGGPIQDDEALFLFAMIRVMRMERILEVGGLNGYSATNFLQAIGPTGTLYTVDLEPVPRQGPNHYTIERDAITISYDDVHHLPLDLIFFDCHVYTAQMQLLHNLTQAGAITPRTVLALHDTNLHPFGDPENQRMVPGGWVHQPVERQMVNVLRNNGWEAFCLHTDAAKHNPHLPVRHGLTLLSRPEHLPV